MYMYLRANLFIIVYTILVPDVSHDFWSYVKRKSKVFPFPVSNLQAFIPSEDLNRT